MSCGEISIDVPLKFYLLHIHWLHLGGLLSLQLLGRLGFFPQLQMSLLKKRQKQIAVCFFPETIGLKTTGPFVKKNNGLNQPFLFLYEKPCFFLQFCALGGAIDQRSGNSWIRSSSFLGSKEAKKSRQKYEETQIWPVISGNQRLYIWKL